MKITLVRNFSFVVKDSEGKEKPLMKVEFEPFDAVLVQTACDFLMLKNKCEYDKINEFCNCIGYDVMDSWLLDDYNYGLALTGFYRILPVQLYLRINGEALYKIKGVEFTNK